MNKPGPMNRLFQKASKGILGKNIGFQDSGTGIRSMIDEDEIEKDIDMNIEGDEFDLESSSVKTCKY